MSSVNTAMRGRGRGRSNGRGGRSGFFGGRTPFSRGRGRGHVQGGQGRTEKSRCQICKKSNHEVVDCWHRFDEDYQIEERFVGAVAPSYGVNTNWYTYTGATDHVIGELNNLTTHEK
jgi:hypothetical protein